MLLRALVGAFHYLLMADRAVALEVGEGRKETLSKQQEVLLILKVHAFLPVC